ncbi:metallophosphoesterase family protein [Methanocella conradii]|uniref:metallophosphoesterase family protein n=1 Tax=Methanocella conradii TaxID=1175444 RepID=UPI00157DFC03|nr:metallophosphoesterase [Methanocella conradii]
MGSILLFSDVHADICALEEILRLAFCSDFSKRYGPLEKAINLGDVLERGHSPAEVVRRLMGLEGLESILGNHDEAFLYGMPVSGSDFESKLVHGEYRRTGEYKEFFRGMGKCYVDAGNKLYCVHGGPIDPCAITPPRSCGVEAWLYTQPWQRISASRYVDASGYHYTPGDAFDAVRPTFGGPGFAIVCGHEHEEAAYRQKGGVVEDVLDTLKRAYFEMEGRKVHEKALPIDDDASYLVRLGIAGPEGYGKEDRCYFGVFTTGKNRAIYLLNFKPERPEHG